MSLKMLRTTSENPDFINLVKYLDAYLKIIDGEDHTFYKKYNTIKHLQNVVLFFVDNVAVGCGAIKEFDINSMEIKRMFVSPKKRGLNIGTKILNELEKWVKEKGYKKCVLETGNKMNDAIHFYKKNEYEQIENYGQYKGIKTSICFEKHL